MQFNVTSYKPTGDTVHAGSPLKLHSALRYQMVSNCGPGGARGADRESDAISDGAAAQPQRNPGLNECVGGGQYIAVTVNVHSALLGTIGATLKAYSAKIGIGASGVGAATARTDNFAVRLHGNASRIVVSCCNRIRHFARRSGRIEGLVQTAVGAESRETHVRSAGDRAVTSHHQFAVRLHDSARCDIVIVVAWRGWQYHHPVALNDVSSVPSGLRRIAQ